MQTSESGNIFTSWHLGILYENGENVEKSIDKALLYYQKSVEQGNSSGMRRIRMCYSNEYQIHLIIFIFRINNQRNFYFESLMFNVLYLTLTKY